MYSEVLSPGGFSVLSALTASGILSRFYLAGGTALALQLGHRKSVDLDWFTPQSFDQGTMLAHLQSIGDVAVSQQAPGTLHIVFGGMRLSFFHYPYLLVESLVETSYCRLASPLDIGLMKMIAMANRGSKKDFCDLYQIAKEVTSLDTLFCRLPEKYPHLHYSTYHLLRSMAYFDDAEQEPDPVWIHPVDWETIKAFFRLTQYDMMSKYEQR